MKRKFTLWMLACIMASLGLVTQIYAAPILSDLKSPTSLKLPSAGTSTAILSEGFEGTPCFPATWKV
ncbi:MAG: hypothetical protein RRY15_07270, partial [Bacteroidales bacterium]